MEFQRVLVISIDGVAPRFITPKSMPHLCALARTGASCFSARTVFPSITTPAHASMLRGIDPSVHGIIDNTPKVLSTDWPSFLLQAKTAGRSTAALLNWPPINALVEDHAADQRFYLDGGYGNTDDERIATEAQTVLASRPDVAFAYLISPDVAGHDHGWGSAQYYDALATADAALASILDAAGDDCAILVTTDHGGHGTDHTASEPIDMVTFVVLRAVGVDPLTSFAEASILDVAPTVAELAGFPPAPAWSGISLAGTEQPLADRLVDMLASMRKHSYGEAVNMEEHSLFTAAQARTAGASPELIAACLLHDVGHLYGVTGAWGSPDHASAGAAVLQQLLPPAVVEPIRLHVDAKRFLVATDPDYVDTLSTASRASLIEQGGPLDDAECVAFRNRPWAAEAIVLRRFDDSGKGPGSPPPLDDFRPILQQVLG